MHPQVLRASAVGVGLVYGSIKLKSYQVRRRDVRHAPAVDALRDSKLKRAQDTS